WHQGDHGRHADQFAEGVACGDAERARRRQNGGRVHLQAKPRRHGHHPAGPARFRMEQTAFRRLKAAADQCKPNLVGNTYAGNISIDDGQKQAGDWLLKYPDADYIYAVAGIFAVGAAQQTKRVHAHAKVVTGNITRRTPDLIKDGSMAMVVSEPAIVF